MYRQFIEFQMLDISREPMEVAPTAHYSMGGIVVEPETHATDVPGLFAAGECTAGLHGANRLGGNSLTDTMVFGRRAGSAAAGSSAVPSDEVDDLALQADSELDALIRPGSRTARQVDEDLAAAMWEGCGVLREEGGLLAAAHRLDDVRAGLEEVGVEAGPAGAASLGHVLDLRAGLLSAAATIRGAAERRETRGCHNRADHPELDPALRVNFHQRRESGGEVRIWAEPVPEIPERLRRLIEQTPDLQEPHRLLE